MIGFERRIAIVYALTSTGDVEVGRIFYRGRDYELIVASGEDD